jgi:hypothetical protein
MGEALCARAYRFFRTYRKRSLWRKVVLIRFSALVRRAAHFVGVLKRIAQFTFENEGEGYWVASVAASKISSALPKTIQAWLPRRLRSAEVDPPRLQVAQLDTAIWEKVLRAMARTVVNEQVDDWEEHFSGLRSVVRKVVASSTADGLTMSEKEDLVQRLTMRLDELEKSWPVPKQIEPHQSRIGAG